MWARLIATVKLIGGPRDVPTGSLTFLDGTTELGTVPLRRGRARLVTSELVPGRNTIQVQYSSGTGMVPSTATVIATVRPSRSGSKVISFPAVPHAAPRLLSTAPQAVGGLANTTDALTPVGGPTFLGTVPVDQGASSTGPEFKKRQQSVLQG